MWLIFQTFSENLTSAVIIEPIVILYHDANPNFYPKMLKFRPKAELILKVMETWTGW